MTDAPRKRLDQPEHRFSHWFNEWLERVLPEPCWYSAVDHSGPVGNKTDTPEERARKRMRWEQRLRAIGVKPSGLDWPAIIQFRGDGFVQAICWIELKRGDNKPTEGQKVTMRLLTERKQIARPAWDIKQCHAIMVLAGFVLHSNASNLAREYDERLDASDRAAPAKAAVRAKRAASSKPRPVKPALGRTRKVEAVRGRVMF